MRRFTAVLALTLAALGTASAQSPPSPLSNVVSTNPLGFLQLGPNLELEHAVSTSSGLGVGIRLPSLGLMSHVIDDKIQGGLGVYGVWHYYPGELPLRGWYVGPHLEIGTTDSGDYDSKGWGVGAEFGYRWVRPNGFSMVLGGLLGTAKFDDTWKDGSGSAGSEQYFIWMLNFSLGVAK